MEELKEKLNSWNIAKFVVRCLGGVGAGILIGAGLSGIDTSKYKGLSKAAIALGAIGLADCCNEAASKQLEKRVDEIHGIMDKSSEIADKICDKMDEIKGKEESAKS